MITREVKVNLASGLHARPASNFVNLAKGFKSKITVSYNGKNSDPKSILNVLSLGVPRGALISISAEGEDETQAVSSLCSFVEKED